MSIETGRVTPLACPLGDCEDPSWNSEIGEFCVKHKAQMEAKYGGIREPALEAKVSRIRTPPPTKEYEPEPDYVFPTDPAPAPEPLREVASQRATSRKRHPAAQPAPDDTLAYLSDALEGRLGAIKAAQAQVLVQLAADALRAL